MDHPKDYSLFGWKMDFSYEIWVSRGIRHGTLQVGNVGSIVEKHLRGSTSQDPIFLMGFGEMIRICLEKSP